MSHVSYASGLDQFLHVPDFTLQNMSSNVWLKAVDNGTTERRGIHIGKTFGNFCNAGDEVVDGLVVTNVPVAYKESLSIGRRIERSGTDPDDDAGVSASLLGPGDGSASAMTTVVLLTGGSTLERERVFKYAGDKGLLAGDASVNSTINSQCFTGDAVTVVRETTYDV